MKSIFKVLVDGEYEFHLSQEDIDRLDFSPMSSGAFHILSDTKSYHTELVGQDLASKQYTVRVNGKVHVVEISNEMDQLIEQLGLNESTVHTHSDVPAPMPGLVLQILVENGQEVIHGEPLVILEAMKMENVLNSPTDGVVTQIHVRQGESVDKGQVLIAIN
jgi:biotin carboxyl carrier protein